MDMFHDIAICHDYVTAMDRQFGEILDEPEQRGAVDDAIIFYSADHDGATSGGKRYFTDTGVRIPLQIHLSGKWQRLSDFRTSQIVGEPVALPRRYFPFVE